MEVACRLLDGRLLPDFSVVSAARKLSAWAFIRSIVSGVRLGESLLIKEVATTMASFQVLQCEMSMAGTSHEGGMEMLKR